ncbi:MAG: hypothetical protein QM756_09360 [Polyangiaceae bacterium]
MGGAHAAGGSSGAGASEVGGGEVGGGEVGGGPTEPTFPLEGSWNVELQVSGSSIACDAVPATLHFEPLDDRTVEVISGRDGIVHRDLVVRNSYGRYVGPAGFGLPLTSDTCPLEFATFFAPEIWATGNGRAESLHFQGSSSKLLIEGDMVEQVDFSVSISSSEPDTVAPSLLVPERVHPLDGVWIKAREPIDTATNVVLRSGGQRVELQGYHPNDSAYRSFYTSVALPFGSTWDVVAEGNDLVGLDFADTYVLTTLDDPGLWQPDGFEGDVPWLATGEPRLVEGVGLMPAISGFRSLFVPPDASVTLHLPRPSGTSGLRFRARVLCQTTPCVGSQPPLEVAVIGGAPHSNPMAVASPLDVTPTGDPKWQYARAPIAYSVELPELGDELVVRISSPGCSSGGSCGSDDPAYLLDDLRAE